MNLKATIAVIRALRAFELAGIPFAEICAIIKSPEFNALIKRFHIPWLITLVNIAQVLCALTDDNREIVINTLGDILDPQNEEIA